MPDVKVVIERIDADGAVPLWLRAEHTTVFTHPEVLASLAHDVHWWLATADGEPACLWPVCVDAAGRATSPEFAYYLGPFDVGAFDPSPRRRLMRAVAIQHKLLGALSVTYHHLSWSTLPRRHELRPWLWFESAGNRAAVRPRFTAVLDGLEGATDEQILQRFSSERRNQVRKAERSGARVIGDVAIARVEALYCETMGSGRAGELARRRLGELRSMYRLVSQGHGFLVACGLEGDETIRGVWLVLMGKGRACGVIAVSDAAWRRDCFNAFGQHRALVAARDAGARCYDFNGANSYARGSDKHSYGAEAELYFDCTFGPP